jgi:glycosyltransferase involved in cell wall biosynthesis
MKLLYCIPALHNTGGMERVMSIKANFLADLTDYEIYIVTTDHRLNQELSYPLNPRIKVIHLDLDFEAHFKSTLISKTISHHRKLWSYKKQLKAIIDENQIDICISLCGKEIDFFGNLNVNCIRVGEIHFSINNRSQFLSARKRGLLWKALGALRTYQLIQSAKKLDTFVVLTKEDEKQWLMYSKNVLRIPNPAVFNPLSTSKLNNKNVIAVGRLSPQKGYDMLIDAWSKVCQIYPDWKLEIYGDGELKDVLSKKISDSWMDNCVKLCGVVSDIQDKYLESSIFVLSSLYEGLPMAMIEAMTCGLPIVAFDCEYGPRELVTNEYNGFLVEPQDVNSLADKIIQLIDNADLRTTFGGNSIQKSKELAVDKIMNEWIALFTKLYSQKK